MKVEDYIKQHTPKIKNYVKLALRNVNCISEADDTFQSVCIKMFRKYPEKDESEYDKLLPKICGSTAIDVYRSKNNVKSLALKAISISNLLQNERGEPSDLEIEAGKEPISYAKIESMIDYYIDALVKRYIAQAETKDIPSNTVHLQVFRRVCYGERQNDIFADYPSYKYSTLRGAIRRMRSYLVKQILEGKLMTFEQLLEE